MDLSRLRTFRTVATLMNFNRSAEVLHLAQSTVSAQIKALEEEVGQTLFERLGRQIRLSRAGERMLDYTHKLLAIEEEAMSAVSGVGEPSGLLTLRVPQTVAIYYLPKILARFQPLYPNVRLDVSSCAYHSLERELKTGSVDLAFLLSDSIRSVQLAVEMVAAVDLVLVAGPDHPLVSRSEIGYRDLQGCSVFLPKADCGYRMIFEQELAAENVTNSNISEFNSIEAIKQCVMAGLGITLIPEISVREALQQKKLKVLSWTESWETGVLMIWHREKWVSPMMSAFMDTVRAVMRTG